MREVKLTISANISPESCDAIPVHNLELATAQIIGEQGEYLASVLAYSKAVDMKGRVHISQGGANGMTNTGAKHDLPVAQGFGPRAGSNRVGAGAVVWAHGRRWMPTRSSRLQQGQPHRGAEQSAPVW